MLIKCYRYKIFADYNFLLYIFTGILSNAIFIIAIMLTFNDFNFDWIPNSVIKS